jgi:proteasome accessory factor A
VAKQRLVDGYADRHGIEPGSPRLKAIDLQYHDLRPAKGLAGRAGLETIIDPADVVSAVTSPPTTTRAYFRGRCLDKYPDEIVAANWDSIVFDVGREPLRRVPMMEPLRGTADHVARLIDESDSAVELLERLGS